LACFLEATVQTWNRSSSWDRWAQREFRKRRKNKYRILVHSIKVGDYFIRNTLAVLIPVGTIFFFAALVVAEGSIYEEYGEEEEIEVGEEMAKESGNAPEKSSHQFGNIVKVA
jgi:hypothetical protein